MRIASIGLSPAVAGRWRRSGQRRERRLHLAARVRVAGCFGRCDSGRKSLSGCGHIAEACKELAELEVTGDVSRMRSQKLTEMPLGGRIVAQLRAFERQAVTRERVVRAGLHESFENLAARLRCLSHGSGNAIIMGDSAGAKITQRNSRGEFDRQGIR